jgi:hypothetical protein
LIAEDLSFINLSIVAQFVAGIGEVPGPRIVYRWSREEDKAGWFGRLEEAHKHVKCGKRGID